MKGGASLTRSIGSREIGMNTAKINVQYANSAPIEEIITYSSAPVGYARPTSGSISMAPAMLQKSIATRSYSPKPQTAKQGQFIGGKRRSRSARRKTRKTLRHSHRRK